MSPLSEAALLTALGLSVVGAVGVVAARRTLYAAFWLAVVGVGTAAFMALMGFTYIAIFHLLIYVGASVSFLAFTVLMIEPEQEPPPRHSLLRGLLAVGVGIVLTIPLALLLLRGGVTTQRVTIQLSQFTNMLATRFEYPVIVTLIALAAVLIEAVAIARRPTRA